MDLFVNLLIAHLLADFPLQKDSWVKNKQVKKLCGIGMWKHFIVVLLITLAAFGCIDGSYILVSAIISVMHIVIDYFKVKFTKNGPRAFALDQITHVIVLFGVTVIVAKYSNWHQWGIVPHGKELLYPLTICGYLFCLSPANYVIREVLKYYHVQDGEKIRGSTTNDSIGISGFIGSMERFLVLTFILMGNYEAAGLTIAAKSLLRFNDNEGPRTEFVLVGTLLSIVIAVVCAIVIFRFGMDVSFLKKP